MKIVNVIPLKKGLLKTDLSYFTTKDVENGNIVTVNLRGKKILALAVSVEDVSDAKISIKGLDFNLKKVIEVKGKSVFLKEYIFSALEAGKYFASNKMSAMATLIPAVFREEYDKLFLSSNINPTQNQSEHRAPKNEKLLLQETFENRISIYKTLIRENFASKKSIFIVLPNESEVEIMKEQLSRGIEQFTFEIHGVFSTKKILQKFNDIADMEHPVLIIGTAPFLSIPRSDLGLIILENESSSSYKMINHPHIDLRVFVEIFAANINAKFILSDNLLRFETIARRELDGLSPMYPLSFRINFNKEIVIENPRPKLEIGVAGKNQTPIFKIFSENSIKEMRDILAKKEKIFVFTLRKGLATSTVCMDCGTVVACDKCESPLVLYKSREEKGRIFVCNRCGEEKNTEIKCIDCQSWNLKPFGIGTDTVLEELSKVFPKTKILKLDKESAKTKKGAKDIAKEFEEENSNILIGTEMALFYIKNKVSMSVVASFDSFWSIPNFKMSEKIIQLVYSLISKTENKFIIQTKNEKDPTILAIQSRNLLSFVRTELEDRGKLSYPPFKRFIKIKYIGNKKQTIEVKKYLEEFFKEYNPLIFSGFIAQVKDKYITNTLIKLEPKNWSLSKISLGSCIDEKLSNKLLSLPSSFEIFIDPEDLL